MIPSQEEVKQFEHKFQGSLQKLDQFEKEWNHFKTNTLTDNASVNQSQEFDHKRIDSRIHCSFDAGQLLNKQKNFPPLLQDQDYQSLTKKSNKHYELKNQLDQIIESPRESMLQSPTAANNAKIHALLKQKQQNQCKTLKIDLNEGKDSQGINQVRVMKTPQQTQKRTITRGF